MQSGIAYAAVFLVSGMMTAAPWSSHGPLNGTISRIVVSAANPTVMYASAPDGVFRSRNGGASWTNVSGPVVKSSGIVVDATNPDVVIASASNGVFRTEDGGTVWQTSAGLPADANPGNIVVDPRHSNVVYVVADHCGIYKSVDGARTFTALTKAARGTKLPCSEGLLLDPLNPDRLYNPFVLGNVPGNDRSEDGGRTWNPLSCDSGPVLNCVESPRRGPIATSGSQRYAIGSLESIFTDYGVLLKSADGVTWSRVYVPNPGFYGWEFSDVAVDPLSGRIFLATNNGTYRIDNGTEMTKLDGTEAETVNAIHYDPATGALLIGTDRSLFRSAGFPWNRWTDLNVGNSAMPVRQIVMDPSNGDVYARSHRQIYRGREFGTSWQAIDADPLEDKSAEIGVDGAHDVYAFYTAPDWYSEVQKLTAGGHWTAVLATVRVAQIVPDPHTPGTLYVLAYNAIHRTRDGAASWENLIPPGIVTSLVIDPRNPDMLVAATTTAVVKSSDGGKTWSSNLSPLFAKNWIGAAPSNPDVLYGIGGLTYSGPTVLTRSTDGGSTWIPLPTPGEPVTGIAIDPHDANRIFVATTNHRVFRSDNGGVLWQSIRDGLPDVGIVSIAIDSAGTFLHVATETRGVWELPLASRRRAIRPR